MIGGIPTEWNCKCDFRLTVWIPIHPSQMLEVGGRPTIWAGFYEIISSHLTPPPLGFITTMLHPPPPNSPWPQRPPSSFDALPSNSATRNRSTRCTPLSAAPAPCSVPALAGSIPFSLLKGGRHFWGRIPSFEKEALGLNPWDGGPNFDNV